MLQEIIVRGAREHNLKNIDVVIPRDRLVVITGLSGSGKSSLAFDTIYAEGQRRYVESLSSYARQFLGQMEKPDVDNIEGLSPAISIEQKSTHRNPRSTVGTTTEIYDYIRLLYARLGVPHCPQCGKKVHAVGVDQIVERVQQLPAESRLQILAPVVRGKKGEHHDLLEKARKSGFVRVRVDGILYALEDEITINKNRKHNIEIVVDRIILREGIASRLADSIETALNLEETEGLVTVLCGDDEHIFSRSLHCNTCNISISPPEPRSFSFNSPQGACPACDGLGFQMGFSEDLIVGDDSLSLWEGCLEAWGKSQSYWYLATVQALGDKLDFDVNTPWKKLPAAIKKKILYGDENLHLEVTDESGEYVWHRNYEGVIPNLMRRYTETRSDSMRTWMEQFMINQNCPDCRGHRLRRDSLAVTVDGKNIGQLGEYSLENLSAFFNGYTVEEKDTVIAEPIMKEIRSRLAFLNDVGVGYLSLNRSAGTLSGGEAQRIRLATQIGSSLMGVLYILDEPSIGLHQRDNDRLLNTLKVLRDLGNTVIVIEHDEDTIREADYVIDIGPGAGSHGGQVVAWGTPAEISKNPKSITGRFINGEDYVPVRKERRPGNGLFVEVKGGRENNLKNVNAAFPLGMMTVVTGVSGSGKSSLVNSILYKATASKLMHVKASPGRHKSITGMRNIDKVINIDQSPIGRTPRSNPATYTGLFGPIRDLFAALPESKLRGYKAGRFSFNVASGRCENCEGAGILKIEMHFLADVYVQCKVCRGRRYNRETLEVRYKGKNIYNVLEMTIEEGAEFFRNIPAVYRRLKTLLEVGLGYIKLGQPATTLSGGEAQRVKLATELTKKSTGRTLYILDEPTTGLHFADVKKLMEVLNNLVDQGNSMVVIEHNLDVIKCADWIVDLGPEGGDRGGQILFSGRPEDIGSCAESYTGRFLEPVLKNAVRE